MLHLKTDCPLKAQNAGLFISRGNAPHVTRIIESHELIFVKQGELDMWEGDQTFHLEAGDTLHLWPGRQHGGSKMMPLDLKFYWIHFELMELEYPSDSGSQGMGSAVNIPQLNHIPQPERLERLFRTFLDDQETGLLHPYSANLLTMLMLIEVAQSLEERVPASDDINVVATWAHTYIRINYERPITTHRIAQALGYNADYLGRIYRKVYGCTLTEAIHNRRISRACDFLLDSNMTIEQIAQKCGFSDPDYFRRLFRRYIRIPPGEYRNEYSHMHVNTH
ncbi:MAG: AraC family transcriptional regulator [Chloroflexota bacterium]